MDNDEIIGRWDERKIRIPPLTALLAFSMVNVPSHLLNKAPKTPIKVLSFFTQAAGYICPFHEFSAQWEADKVYVGNFVYYTVRTLRNVQ